MAHPTAQASSRAQQGAERHQPLCRQFLFVDALASRPPHATKAQHVAVYLTVSRCDIHRGAFAQWRPRIAHANAASDGRRAVGITYPTRVPWRAMKSLAGDERDRSDAPAVPARPLKRHKVCGDDGDDAAEAGDDGHAVAVSDCTHHTCVPTARTP
jgi:hypothetical protein